MEKENDAKNLYLEKVAENLIKEGYVITKNVRYDDLSFDLVSRRKKFQFEKFGLVFVFYCFKYFTSPDLNTLKLFSKQSFKFSLKSGFRPPRGLCSVECFPVAIVDSILPQDAEKIRTQAPPTHWTASEMLVVLELSKKTLHYCEITPSWGSIYYDQMRDDIKRLLSP